MKKYQDDPPEEEENDPNNGEIPNEPDPGDTPPP